MKKKLEMQIKQKEEMGEVLHEVDFNQLKIENQQYLEKIDEKNQELLRLKLMAGNTLQVMMNGLNDCFISVGVACLFVHALRSRTAKNTN